MGRLVRALCDRLVAGIALLVLSPLLAAIALIIRIRFGSPILFRQTRPGLHGRLFTLYKFRTMSIGHDAEGRPLPDGLRLSRLGRLLRKTSLDELPELWNVLKGEMSLVGPRPLLVEYLPLYTPEQARRHDVLPGITGWAQVSGRNALSWDEKFELDTWYVDNCSPWLDLKILCRTVVGVVRSDGICQPGHETASCYTGSTSARRAPVVSAERSG